MSCCLEFALTTQGTVWEFYPRSSFEMIYGLKTVLRIVHILDIKKRQVPSISEPVNWTFPNNRELRRIRRTKATNAGLGIAGIDKFRLTNIIFLNLITFGHSIASIVLGEIIPWSLLKIRINAGSDKVYSIQLVCFCSVSCERNSVWSVSVIGGFRWHWPWLAILPNNNFI